MSTVKDFQHPIPSLEAGTMAIYRAPARGGTWRPIAALIIKLNPRKVTIKIAGRKGFVHGFQEIQVNRSKLFPPTMTTESFLEEYKAGELI